MKPHTFEVKLNQFEGNMGDSKGIDGNQWGFEGNPRICKEMLGVSGNLA